MRFVVKMVKISWELLRQAFWKWNADKAPRLGAALAYYTVLSLAPLLVIIVAIVGLYFGRQAAEGRIVWEIQSLVGSEGAKAIQTMIQNAYRPTAGIMATTLGVLTLLLGASGVFGELRDSLNTILEYEPAGGAGLLGAVKYRFFSFAMVLGIGFLLLVSLVVTAALAAIGKFFGGLLPVPEFVLHLGALVVSFLVITVLFAMIYKFVPDVRIDWRDVWTGAAVTSLLFSFGKALIGLYLGKSGFSSAYGTAGSLVIVLVWIYYSAQIFFYGAEFTYIYAITFGSRSREAKPMGHLQQMSESYAAHKCGASEGDSPC